MGWMFCRKVPGYTPLDYMKGCFTSSDPARAKYEVVDHSFTSTAGYVAVQYTNFEKGWQPYIFAAVMLIDQSGGEFGYKDMDESMGPVQSDCPARILNLLTPLEDIERITGRSQGYAVEWRKRCRDNLAAKRPPKLPVKITEGTVATWPTPLKFGDGVERTRFTATLRGTKKVRWRADDGVLCQIPQRLLALAQFSPA